jgi:sugar phosphate isomerase/epimerase
LRIQYAIRNTQYISMRFIFSTGSLWSYSIERCFAFAAAAGYDGVELMVDGRWETRQTGYLQPLMERYGIPVAAVHSPFMGYVPGWPNDQMGRIVESVKLAAELGARVVVHHLPIRMGYLWIQAGPRLFPLPVPGWNQERGYRRWLAEAYLAYHHQTLDQSGVTLCIENMPAQNKFGRRWNWHHWNRPEEMQRFPAITMDTTHLGTWGWQPVEAYARFAGRVRHVHLSNYDGKEHRRPEMGYLHLDKLLALMAAEGYPGAISLELHPDALAAGQPDAQVIECMAGSLDFCRAAVKREA